MDKSWRNLLDKEQKTYSYSEEKMMKIKKQKAQKSVSQKNP